MHNKVFGPTKKAVSLVGQGTWQMEKNDRATCVKALQHGIELGMTHIDTAELYGAGQVEELVAEAIKEHRGKVFLASKVKPQNASRAKTIESCEKSLRRLKTDRLDLYMLHWQGKHPLQETIAGFEALREQGKILAYGVSNFDVPALTEFISMVGSGRLACNQVLYHIEDRGIEHAVLPFCEAHQIAVVAYSPFYVGRFPPEGVGGQVLRSIAAAHNVSVHQVVLQFLLRRPGVFVIPKTTSLAHLEDNAAAVTLQLSDDDVSRLDEAFPLGVDHGLPTI
jgi:diketogulonate reductase-like aldo/keto reductase